MRKIADWLKQIGLSDYARQFAENDIDFSILPDLTDHGLLREKRSNSKGYRFAFS
jgi:hypothetical protein